MKHFKSLTAILVMLTLVLASCGSQTPINDASSSTDQSTDGSGENLGAEGIIVVPDRIAPTLTIKAIGYQNIDLRVATDLAPFFEITHPTAKKIQLNITSDKDGLLYNNVWSTDKLATTLPTLLRTFNTVGTRKITVVASVGALAAYRNTGTFYLNVINTAPVIKLHYDGSPHVGESFWVTAQIFDKNEPDGTKMCANTTWTLDAPNTLDSSTGCQVKLTFSNVFTYQLRVSTHDSEGAEAVNAVNLTVLPAFVDQELKNLRTFYMANPDPTLYLGQTVDLTRGKDYFLDFFGSREGLSFRTIWTLFVTDDQGEESVLDTIKGFNIGYGGRFYTSVGILGGGGTAPVTRDCRMTVKITSPNGRITTVPVWVGKCTYYTQKLN
jgi:hypothetical protein